MGTYREQEDELATLQQELDEANGRADATRAFAIAANANLRSLLLSALGREDDGCTSLSEYCQALAADRDRWRRDRNTLARQCADLRDELDTAKAALTTARENSDQAWRDAHTLFATIREADRTIVEAVLPLVAASKLSTAPRTPAYEAVIEAVDRYLAAVDALPPEMRPA